ncbi:MAG: hydroxypyruvate isomerase family protein [Phycisphaerales bacterium]
MSVTRRTFVSASAALIAAGTAPAAMATDDPPGPSMKPERKGNLKQSVCRWCFSGMKLADLAQAAKGMGLTSIELLNPDEWAEVRAAGLECAVASFVKSNPIGKGFNRVEHHDAIIADLEERLPLVKEAGIPAQIVFSGNRAGLSDRDGLENCARGLRRITPLAEKLGITIVMELLNSKVDHKDYQCDRTPWGAELVQKVGSPRFKLLYDIYHMQIMEGDVIRTVKEHFDAIGHFHTAGVPGRREIDATQELNYRAICGAILSKGYTGYLGQEFIPSREAMVSLREAVEICDV